MGIKIFLLRIIICFLLSLIIGIERQLRHKIVGLRTNVLVCLGAFLFVYLSFGVKVGDSSRIAAQVVSGIGFLGAGVILRDGDKVKGLNTAATLWCMAAIGALCAAGLLIEASIGTLFVLLSNIILRFISIKIMDKLSQSNNEKYIISIKCLTKHEEIVRQLMIKTINKNGLNFDSLEISELNNEKINLEAIIHTTYNFKIENIINRLGINKNIQSITFQKQSIPKIDNEDFDEE